jgi:hypothetical protein
MESWEFGRAVRRWRDRVQPAAAGVPVGGRRRAVGLRREELCDTLVVAASDLRIMIYTAEPDTEDAERLSLAIVLGTQSLID